MAGDWMKVEHSTPDKPEILAIASELNVSPDEAFGLCFRMWRWFDQHTVNGNAPCVTPALLDRYLGVTGFATAAIHCGWLRADNGCLELVNFAYHNGETAKQRALSAKRVKVSRDKTCNAKRNAKRNGTSVTASSLLFSSLLSSLNSGQGIPKVLQTSAFREAWDSWVHHREEIKKPLKPTQVQSQLSSMAELGHDRAVAMIRHTVLKGWQGLREPEPGQNGGIPQPKNQPLLDKLLREYEEEEASNGQ